MKTKRNKATNKLFAMEKLKPEDLKGLRQQIILLEARLRATRLIGDINK